MKTNKLAIAFAAVLLTVSLSACTGIINDTNTNEPEKTDTTENFISENTNTQSTESGQSASSPAITLGSDGAVIPEATPDVSGGGVITLNGTTAEYGKEGVVISGGIVTITAPGTYTLTGTLTEGQIIVNAGKESAVELILNGVAVICSNSSALLIVSADKTILNLTENTVNTFTDGASYTLPEGSDEPDAAIFSKDDLTVKGSGTLNVNANYNDGIVSKNDLKIKNGIINITSAGDGMRGRDSVQIEDAAITVTSGADGIKSTNADEEGRGFVLIDSGKLDITSGQDGIQAETYLTVNGGDIKITSGGGSANASFGNTSGGWGGWGRPGGNQSDTKTDEESAKGLKASTVLTVNGGTITLNTSDDSIHSDKTVVVSGGNITISSGDDGIHADAVLTISKGDVTITKSYEGIESAEINISGGTVHLTASDDGLNAAGGNDSSSISGRPGMGGFESSTGTINITGGYLYVNSSGDGVDSNGNISMSGGTVLVSGPTDNGNGALDYGGSFNISGGTLIAAGSTGMAQTISTASTQCGIIAVTGSKSAGTLVTITDSNGNVIASFSPVKTFGCVVITSSEIVKGESYKIYTGGSNSALNTDGYATSGTVSGASELCSYTQTSISMSYGSTGGMNPGGPGGRH